MKAAFHYLVKAKLIRYINADDINFIEIEEKFENENPILAREAAFNFYQNYIDVLLESKGLKYQSDNQARKELQSFIDSGPKKKKEKTGNESEDKLSELFDDLYDSTFGNGIGVFFVIDKPIAEAKESLRDEVGEESLIHGIGSHNIFSGIQHLMDGLVTEYNYYRSFGYSINDKKIVVNFLEEGEEEPYLEEILKTPFDWTEFDLPSVIATLSEVEQKWLEVINGGEGKKVEFKSTLRYHIHLKTADKIIEHEIAKTIAAFLNCEGGILIVGVDDDNNILGLENDFSLYSKNQEDKFFQAFKNLLENYFGLGIVARLNFDFASIRKKQIFYIEVFESKNPIYLNNKGAKEFYVRVGTSSSLYDVEQAVNYIIDRF